MTDLIERERGFWLNGGDHYDEHADEEAIYVVPKKDGILDHAAAARIIQDSGIWDEVDMEDLRRQELGEGIEVLTYRATGRRDGAVFHANCSTIYRGGKLIHHQQTPIPAED
ncbi:hypothetical protein BCF33_2248 [Hasllibacter halocynthiae]|uniref:Nuclear transport factor 2 family protein n=1 Tax=Hasllibacter halocynthiae TaxID=595589 RepID=A0A2T0X363_9RHOB|nr:hypothetical protein [Hasllibacter halocynthiae]PRY93380.1 hypothetical protein BCF33_2248 [Hasllibacter halocynthiae]